MSDDKMWEEDFMQRTKDLASSKTFEEVFIKAIKLMCSDCQEIIEINGQIGDFKTISHKCPENVRVEIKEVIPHSSIGTCPRAMAGGCRACAN